MSFSCVIELTGGDTLLEEHKVVTMVAKKNGKEVDRFNASIEDLANVDFFNPRVNDRTSYLKLKSHLAKVRN
jgi:hypothetical protein